MGDALRTLRRRQTFRQRANKQSFGIGQTVLLYLNHLSPEQLFKS